MGHRTFSRDDITVRLPKGAFSSELVRSSFDILQKHQFMILSGLDFTHEIHQFKTHAEDFLKKYPYAMAGDQKKLLHSFTRSDLGTLSNPVKEILTRLYEKYDLLACQFISEFSERCPELYQFHGQLKSALTPIYYGPQKSGETINVEHIDHSLFTFVTGLTSKGLIFTGHEHDEVEIRTDEVAVVNGSLISDLTKGQLRPRPHYVVSMENDVRLTFPFFIHPAPDFQIDFGEGRTMKYETFCLKRMVLFHADKGAKQTGLYPPAPKK